MSRPSALSLLALAVLSLGACSEERVAPLAPSDVTLARVGETVPAVVERPFKANSTLVGDFSTTCTVYVPTGPTTSVPVQFSIVDSGPGTSTHFGRHTLVLVKTLCAWDGTKNAFYLEGTWTAEGATGGTVSGTWIVYAYFDGTMAGDMWITSGTGKFEGATGWGETTGTFEVGVGGTSSVDGWIRY